jgi:nitrite reductase/ring-hydroxylating ferredoxin subunit
MKRTMTRSRKSAANKRLALVEELSERRTKKIRFARAGKMIDGFLACHNGRIVAYENECRHLPVSLDYGLDRFYTRDGKYFLCQTHGALYQPRTGLCVHGPCAGEFLRPIPIRIADGAVWLMENPIPTESPTPKPRTRSDRKSIPR